MKNHNMNKAAINLKAEKLTGYKRDVGTLHSSGNPEAAGLAVGFVGRPFSIFTSHADREATVVALLDKNGVSVCGKNGEYFLWDEFNQAHIAGEYHDYTEALIAAVESIK